MKKIWAKLFPNKGLNKYIVHLNSGKKVKVWAKDYEITYYTGTGICATVKFSGHRKRVFFAPASVACVVCK